VKRRVELVGASFEESLANSGLHNGDHTQPVDSSHDLHLLVHHQDDDASVVKATSTRTTTHLDVLS
jgi:hypothetical protein